METCTIIEDLQTYVGKNYNQSIKEINNIVPNNICIIECNKSKYYNKVYYINIIRCLVENETIIEFSWN